MLAHRSVWKGARSGGACARCGVKRCGRTRRARRVATAPPLPPPLRTPPHPSWPCPRQQRGACRGWKHGGSLSPDTHGAGPPDTHSGSCRNTGIRSLQKAWPQTVGPCVGAWIRSLRRANPGWKHGASLSPCTHSPRQWVRALASVRGRARGVGDIVELSCATFRRRPSFGAFLWRPPLAPSFGALLWRPPLALLWRPSLALFFGALLWRPPLAPSFGALI